MFTNQPSTVKFMLNICAINVKRFDKTVNASTTNILKFSKILIIYFIKNISNASK